MKSVALRTLIVLATGLPATHGWANCNAKGPIGSAPSFKLEGPANTSRKFVDAASAPTVAVAVTVCNQGPLGGNPIFSVGGVQLYNGMCTSVVGNVLGVTNVNGGTTTVQYCIDNVVVTQAAARASKARRKK